MKFYNIVSISVIAVLLSACQSMQDYQVNSVLWMQTSAEYEANTRFVYAKAQDQLKTLFKNTSKNKPMPAAVILDIDETILDNSAYNGYQIKTGNNWDANSWDVWVARAKAGLVPGADTFIQTALEQGIEIILVSNRECRMRSEVDKEHCPQKSDTINNLRKHKIVIPENNIYFSSDQNGIETCEKRLNEIIRQEVLIETSRSHNLEEDEIVEQVNRKLYAIKKDGWPSEKKYRRECIKQNYNVIMLIGDDLGDFIDYAKTMTLPERKRITREKVKYWGTSWFILPNPAYGSWRSVIKEAPTRVIRAENL